MKTDDGILKLQAEIDKRIREASASLLNNDVATAQKTIRWIETATKLISRARKEPDNIRWALLVGLVSIVFIGLGLTLRIPRTNISADIETRSVGFVLAKEWVLSNRFSPSELDITNLKTISSAGAGINVSGEQPFSLHLKGKDIVMNTLLFSPGADITIQSHDSSQNFIIKKETLVAEVQVGQAQLNIGEQVDTVVRYEIPEVFKMKSFPSIAVPVAITMVDTAGWSFRDMLISDIHFLEESTPGSGKFISSIVSGNVKVLEIDRDTRLEQGDWLLLENLKDRRMQITKTRSGLKIHIEGEVSGVSAGSELFERTLNPTVIEYLFYAKSFAFFWSSIAFLCSLAWSLKNTIFSKRQ